MDIPKAQMGRRVDDQRTARIEKKLDDFSGKVYEKFDLLYETINKLTRVEEKQAAASLREESLSKTVVDLTEEVANLKRQLSDITAEQKVTIAGRERLWWIFGLVVVAGASLADHFLGQ